MKLDTTNQDRLVAAVAGGLGAVTIIIGSLLPAFNPHGFGALQENTLIQSSYGIYPLFGLLIAWRVYRTYTDRQHPFWIMLAALWTGAWVVIDAVTTEYGTGAQAWIPGPGIGCFVVGFGCLVAVFAGYALWKLEDPGTSIPDRLQSDWSDRQARRNYPTVEQRRAAELAEVEPIGRLRPRK